jgi:hypothetical protein
MKWATDYHSFPQISLIKFNAMLPQKSIAHFISWALNLDITLPGASRESRSAPGFMLLPHFGGKELAQNLKTFW